MRVYFTENSVICLGIGSDGAFTTSTQTYTSATGNGVQLYSVANNYSLYGGQYGQAFYNCTAAPSNSSVTSATVNVNSTGSSATISNTASVKYRPVTSSSQQIRNGGQGGCAVVMQIVVCEGATANPDATNTLCIAGGTGGASGEYVIYSASDATGNSAPRATNGNQRLDGVSVGGQRHAYADSSIGYLYEYKMPRTSLKSKSGAAYLYIGGGACASSRL